MKTIIFHIFRITAAIKLTLPSRQELLNKLLMKRSPDEIRTYADEIIESCTVIERTAQELFKSHNLTSLP